jgi:hypothetical protein
MVVGYGIAGTATQGTDYTVGSGTAGTITFAAGAATAAVTVDPTADTSAESDETVALTLAAGTGYTIGTSGAAVGTITNDDAPATPAPTNPAPLPGATTVWVFDFNADGSAPVDVTALPGYGVATSALFNCGGGGWAGWSVPAGKIVLGAKIISSGDTVADFSVFKAAGPNEVYPHWTYGPAEYGWVLQAKQINHGVQIEVYYANGVDLDVDSNNDDRLNTPKRDPKEEEQEATTPKKIVVNNNDADGDHVPDYADWSIATPGLPAKRFAPLVIQIPASLPVASMQLTVSYAASDPALIGPDQRLPADSAERPLRIWTKNAGEARKTASVITGGHFVPAGRIADLGTLGFTDSTRTVELYVEGIQTAAGASQPISIELALGDRVVTSDLVNVVVVSNTLVIGIDGTDSEAWLSREVGGVPYNERNTQDGTRWNSHVRNLVADSRPFAMTIYSHGPVQGSSPRDTSEAVFRAVRDEARNMITDAGGGTTIAIVGWSRGAMIASGVANDILTLAPGDLPRTVAFIGMYDPVDMSAGIDDAWARVHRDVKAVTIVGPADEDSTRPDLPRYNVDYRTFTRMALAETGGSGTFQWRVTHQGAVNVVRRSYNASHGAIGGTPGYNKDNTDPPNGAYNYVEDRRDSILSDKDIRDGMRRAGLEFVPDRAEAWYGFPETRPPRKYWV